MLPFFVLGLTSIVAQVLIVRELMVTFYGNELFVGLTLGIWLACTATGSLIGRKLLSQKAFIINLVFLAFCLPFTLILIRLFKTLFPAGALIDIVKAIGLTFSSLVPTCFSLGFFFTTAFSCFESKNLSQLVAKAYLVETLGFVCGGLLLNFFLIQKPPLFLALLLSMFILLLATFFVQNKLFLIPAFLLITFTFYYLPDLNHVTLSWQFPNLVETQNSIYGRIAVTKQNNQFNFFESGTLTGISQKTEDAEYLIHPILLSHPQPKKILMIGGGLNGGLFESLKHRPEKIAYVELDPVLVQTVKKYLEQELSAVLEDSRVEISLMDARKFLKESKEKYDVVIINLPLPATALINRLYTKEALAEIKQILASNGILAVNLALPTDYLSQEAKNLSSTLFQTIKQEFSEIMVLPEYTLLLLASNEKVLTDDTNLLAQRLKSRQLETDFISQTYLENRFHNDRIAMFARQIGGRVQELNRESPINSDFFPIAYFYYSTFWQGFFGSRAAAFLNKLSTAGPFILLLIFATFLSFVFARRRALPFFVLGISGASIMIWEIILIFAFQVKLGFIFEKISLLLATILTGMAAGNYLATKFLRSLKSLKIVLTLMAIFSLVLPIILAKAEYQLIFFVLAVIAGILAGTIFPLVTQEYLKEQKQVGSFYAADLLGSFLGAVLSSLFLIPVFGLNVTSYLLTLFLGVILL